MWSPVPTPRPSDLAALNRKVLDAAAGGQSYNELLDKRDALVRDLADLVGGYAVPGRDGQVSVSVNGINLVHGDVAQTLTLSGGTTIDAATTDPPTITWGTTPVPIESGAAAGHLAALRSDLPQVLTDLDGVAASLINAVNTVHATGFTNSGTAGGTFFSGTGARDIALTSTDPTDLAIAAVPGTVDGSVAMKIGDLASDSISSAVLGGSPGPSARWRSLVSGLGSRVEGLNGALTVQNSVVATADDAVAADSGVSLDEEMTGMLMFQRAYQASARVITTVDEMMDTLINRTGVVGR